VEDTSLGEFQQLVKNQNHRRDVWCVISMAREENQSSGVLNVKLDFA
jgi:hypothetical protein